MQSQAYTCDNHYHFCYRCHCVFCAARCGMQCQVLFQLCSACITRHAATAASISRRTLRSSIQSWHTPYSLQTPVPFRSIASLKHKRHNSKKTRCTIISISRPTLLDGEMLQRDTVHSAGPPVNASPACSRKQPSASTSCTASLRFSFS